MQKFFWLLPTIFGIISLLTGIIVYARDPFRRLNQLFLLAMSIAFIWGVANSAVILDWGIPQSQVLWDRTTYVVGFLLAPAFAWFSTYLPKARPPRKRCLVGSIIVSLLIVAIPFLTHLLEGQISEAHTPNRIYLVFYMIVFLGFVIRGFYNTIAKLRAAKTPLEKNQLRILSLGLIISFPTGIIAGVFVPFYTTETWVLNLITVSSIFVFSLFAGYGLLRYGFMAPIPFALDQMFDNFYGGIIVTDYHGAILKRNQALASVLNLTSPIEGMTSEQFAETLASQVEDPEQMAEFNSWLSSAEEGEQELTLGDEPQRVMLVTKSLVKDSRGTPIGRIYTFLDTTDRKRKEFEWRRYSEFYQKILSDNNVSINTINLDGTMMSWNRGSERIFGYTPEEVIGRKPDFLLPESLKPEFDKFLERVLEGGSAEDELQMLRKDGQIIEAFVACTIIRDEDDQPHGIIAIINDITHRKQSEQTLRESEEKYRALVENANEAIIVAQDGIIKFANDKGVQLIGYSKEELASKHFIEFIYPDDRAMVHDRYRRRLAGEEFTDSYVFRIATKNGTIKWVNLSAVRVDWDGKPATLTFLTDMTDSVRLTQELQESRDHLKGLLENANEIIITSDWAGKIISGNKMAVTVIGGTLETLQKRVIFEIITPTYRETARRWIWDWIDGRPSAPVLQLELQTTAGASIPVEASLNVIDSGGEVSGVQIIARDLRPRMEAERRIRELQALNEQIVSNAPLGIVTIDKDGIITSINPAYTRVMGYDSHIDLTGENFFDRPTVKKFRLDNHLKRVLDGEQMEQTYDLHVITTEKDINIKVFGVPLLNESGKCPGALLIIADISREKELERQLAQSEKLSSIGKLVSGVAHELNNPLTAIMGYSQLLSVSADLSERSTDMAQKILHGSERCKKIVENLLSFARRKVPEKIDVNINELIKCTLELREYDLRVNNITVSEQYDSTLPTTAGDPDQLQQVFLNLINNAFDSMHESCGHGTLEIRTYTSEDCFINAEFIDTGPGVSESLVDKIFDPFVTTKAVGKGTGLGLSLSYGILQAHGGSITLDEHYKGGARFIVKIPISACRPVLPSTPPIPEKKHRNGAGSVLLVDDEEQILESTRLLLETHQFTVSVASTGEKAKEILACDSFDVIVTDLRMPGALDGQGLYNLILRERPDLAERMIFVTGDTIAPDIQEFFRKVPNPHIKKPFTGAELTTAINAIMSS